MAGSAQKLWDVARAFMPSRILLTAVELKVFGALGDESKTSVEVASALDTDPRATDRLMDALVALGFLAKSGDRFTNTPETQQSLVPGRPGYAGDALMHAVNMWDSWSTLTAAVTRGTSVFRREGDARADWVRPFISAMHYNASASAPGVALLVDLAGVRRLLDVGGGSGAYSMEFCRAKPDLDAVVFDLPDVVPITREYIEAAGLSDRISTLAGDFTADELPSGFDLVFVSAIIHMNSQEANIDLLRKCARALNPGGRVVIQDFIVDEARTSPPHAAIFALNMLVATRAGDTYTEDEVRSWLAETGFGDVTRVDPPSGATLIIGKRSAV